MHTIKLNDYIRHGMILKNLAEHDIFDAIIYEFFDNSEIEIPENITIHTLDTTNSMKVNAQLMAYADHYERILIILDSFHLHHLSPLLHTPHNETQLTILNLGAGDNNDKGETETQDTTLAVQYGMQTYEITDFVSFFQLLEQKTTESTYIRIPDTEFAGNLFGAETNIDHKQDIIDLSAYELRGNTGTILCTGAYINNCIQAIQADSNNYDVFLLNNRQWDISPALKKSLEKTQKLLFISDQDTNSFYKHYIQSKLYEKGLTGIEILFITAKNSPEELYEQLK